MSIAEKVQQLEVDRDSLHRSYQGKVDELKYVREQFDKHKADFGHLPREVQRLTADRDQWKARAEKAEVKVSELECELYAARSIPRQTVADLQLKAELQQALEAAEKRVKELDSQRVAAEKCVELQAARIAELERTNNELATYRDQWKARAEKAEADLQQMTTAHECRCEFAAEQRNRADAAEKRVKELEEKLAREDRLWADAETERDAYRARIAELQRELGFAKKAAVKNADFWKAHAMSALEELEYCKSSTLEAVLEECLAENICVGVSIVDRGAARRRVRVSVERKGKGRVSYMESFAEAAEKLCETVGDQDFYPDSAFARRRREGEKKDDSSEAIAEMFKEYPRPWKFDVAGNLSAANGELIDDSANLGIMHAVNAYSPQPTPEPTPSPADWSGSDSNPLKDIQEATQRALKEVGWRETPTPPAAPELSAADAILKAIDEPFFGPGDENIELPKSPTCKMSLNQLFAQPDIVAELLERHPGEWKAVADDKDDDDDNTWQISSENPIFCVIRACDIFSKDLQALAELVNRYRRLADLANDPICAELADTWENHRDDDQSPKAEWCRKLFAALRPLFREAKA